LNYAGVSEISNTKEASEFIAERQGYNQEGGGGDIDISSMPLPLQVFTYLFRPLPFEARSVGSFFAAIDNTILLLLCLLHMSTTSLKKEDPPLSHAHPFCSHTPV